jgi:hypothetical protein
VTRRDQRNPIDNIAIRLHYRLRYSGHPIQEGSAIRLVTAFVKQFVFKKNGCFIRDLTWDELSLHQRRNHAPELVIHAITDEGLTEVAARLGVYLHNKKEASA